jgi:mannose-6-phosphate isomerase-like protein (cupin superfamily)
MPYVLTIPPSPSFALKGLKGYQFEPLKNQELDIYFVDVEKGHDTFIISKKITRIYYILEGKGYFTIDNQRYDVEPSMIVEVPPNVEYSYSGTMKLLLISNPRWFKGNEEVTKKNPDVASGLSMSPLLAKLGFKKK